MQQIWPARMHASAQIACSRFGHGGRVPVCLSDPCQTSVSELCVRPSCHGRPPRLYQTMSESDLSRAGPGCIPLYMSPCKVQSCRKKCRHLVVIVVIDPPILKPGPRIYRKPMLMLFWRCFYFRGYESCLGGGKGPFLGT